MTEQFCTIKKDLPFARLKKGDSIYIETDLITTCGLGDIICE